MTFNDKRKKYMVTGKTNLEKDFKEKLKITAERLRVTTDAASYRFFHGWQRPMGDGSGAVACRGTPPGRKNIERIAQACVDFGIESLILYSFSMENWKRPKAEVDALMELYTRYLVEIRPTLTKNNVRLVHLGPVGRAPQHSEKEFIKTIELTAGNTGMVLALALNYSARAEIVDAFKKSAQEYQMRKLYKEHQ